MSKIILLLFSLSLFQAQCQDWEIYDRDLFHMLPIQFPDTVNGVDKNGQKQGWWLVYKVKYNPIDKPDELKKGRYVERYSYGRYEDNRKIGPWKYVENVHLVYEARVDSFYYGKDSTVIISEFTAGGWNKTQTYYDADSTIMEYLHLLPKENYPIQIICNKKLPTDLQCKMTYRESELKVFPFGRLELEKEFLILDSFRERSSDHESIKTDFKNYLILSDQGDSSAIGKYIPPTFNGTVLEEVIKEQIAMKYKTYDSMRFVGTTEILENADVKYGRFKTRSIFQLNYDPWPIDPVLVKLKDKYGMENVSPSGAFTALIKTTETHYAIRYDSSDNWHFVHPAFSDEIRELIPQELIDRE